jgi:hypothetical protein
LTHLNKKSLSGKELNRRVKARFNLKSTQASKKRSMSVKWPNNVSRRSEKRGTPRSRNSRPKVTSSRQVLSKKNVTITTLQSLKLTQRSDSN